MDSDLNTISRRIIELQIEHRDLDFLIGQVFPAGRDICLGVAVRSCLYPRMTHVPREYHWNRHRVSQVART